jgi:hypothetical protein
MPAKYLTRNDQKLCGFCNGSGEGQYDGSRCTHCGGTGVDNDNSLLSCLNRLRDLDEAEDVNVTDHLEAINNVKEKVDSYRYIIEQLTLQADYWSEKQKEAQAMAKRYTSIAEKCRDRLIWNMNNDGSSELQGASSIAKIRKSERVKTRNDVPSEEDIRNHSDYITFSWKWNLSKIRSDLKAEKPDAQSIAELIICDNLQWRNGNASGN